MTVSGSPPGSGGSGQDGVTPHIGGNGNWFIGAVDTGVHAQGPQGEQGIQGPAGGGGGGSGPLVQPFLRNGLVTVGAATTDDPVFSLPINFEIVDFYLVVSEAPTGADLIRDVNLNGTTIFATQANRPRIVAGALHSVAVAVPDLTTIPAHGRLTFDGDQAGSTFQGRNLALIMRYTT